MIGDLKRSYRSIYRQKCLHSLADVAHTRNAGFVEAAEAAGVMAVGNTALKGHRGDRYHRNKQTEKKTTGGNQQNEGNFKSSSKDPKKGHLHHTSVHLKHSRW